MVAWVCESRRLECAGEGGYVTTLGIRLSMRVQFPTTEHIQQELSEMSLSLPHASSVFSSVWEACEVGGLRRGVRLGVAGSPELRRGAASIPGPRALLPGSAALRPRPPLNGV